MLRGVLYENFWENLFIHPLLSKKKEKSKHYKNRDKFSENQEVIEVYSIIYI